VPGVHVRKFEDVVGSLLLLEGFVRTHAKRKARNRALVDRLESRLLLSGAVTNAVGATNLVTIEGSPVSGVLATFKDSNANALSHLTATVAWGDASSGAGAVSFNSSTGNFQVSGTHTYKFDSTYHPVISIVDSLGGSASPVASIYVADAPFHPFGTSITAVAGHSFSGVVASFIDSDPNAKLSYYTTLTINWGDGTVSSGTVAFNSSTHHDDISGTHTYGAGGTYPVLVYVKEIGGMDLKINSTAHVSGPVPSPVLTPFGTTVNGTEGAKFSGVVGSFTNSTPNTTTGNYTATITWGDGHSSTGAVALNTSTHRFDVSGSNTYGEEGSYAVAVAVHSTGGLSTTIHSTAKVGDAALTGVSALSFSGREGQQFGGGVALFADTNPGASGLNFSASINWGDGNSSAGTISFNGGANKWQVNGSHTYRVGGTYQLTVSIHDVGGAGATASPTATIAGAPIFATGIVTTYQQDIMKVTPQLIATFSSGNPLALATDFHVTVDWGDGTTNNPTSTVSVVYNSATNLFNVMATHPYSQIGLTYTLKITITEGSGGTGATVTSLIKIL
jgi:hypothetical protein